MELCNKCEFYNKDYDEHARLLDDLSNKERHFCIMYDEQIPRDIEKDRRKCEFYFKKAGR